MASRGALVGVCGATGAGKSTIVGNLARALGLQAWPERVDENPFFIQYMADRATWALRAQLAFVLGALEDAAAARARPPGGVLQRPAVEILGVFVQDLQKSDLLRVDEVQLLGRLVEIGEELSGVPDVIVMLHASPAELLARIRARARAGEEAYQPADIVRLTERYEAWCVSWNRCPTIDVDTSAIDLRTRSGIARLASDVRGMLATEQDSARRSSCADFILEG